MKQTGIIPSVLEPEDGNVLTQAAENIPLSERVYSDKVFLASNDSPANWREITQAEADAYKAQAATETV